ncbi:hypothetical protein CS063_03805 [Sporanaerobium hydrogeniformans]|uniref:Uncharacterized protein n=1 Tax=Sporanaerobium hydrogeniformans TaxID=3072179 RepID=A0AC61DFZ3_9FIRM|nr:uroporphyrinogen decarboxylase family protein [Sporanaerobium hydrogeniformans]PHV71696.1 hypothetical protein CS063_03805 [Sporanaerobium hydrogeniformans]
MTSKERVRRAIQHQRPDRIPAAFEAVDPVVEKLMNHYGYTDREQLFERFNIDTRYVSPKYIGPELKVYTDPQGREVRQTFWGFEETFTVLDGDKYGTTTFFPLEHVETIEDVEAFNWPSADWFDYEDLKEQCKRYQDKAIVVGHEGPFQIVTYLISMEKFFMLMIDAPEVAQSILDKMVEFELDYYERIFKAAEGQIDILRPHDDYGTQISLLFSVDMWKQFFEENTKKLVQLAHKYNAFYQQHSCGAVQPIIPELIRCGVDILEPLQKVEGLEPETLREKFGGQITFHGGIDTQGILPFGTAAEVQAEVRKYMNILHQNGGYILMASQAFESDVPIENIEAVYSVER